MLPLSYRASRIFVVIALVVAINLLLIIRNQRLYSKPSFVSNSSHCNIPDWNRVETQSVTNSYKGSFSRWLWMKLDLSKDNSQNYTDPSILGAYVYPEYISVTISAQYMSRQHIFCRYYDCKKQEIPGATWQSVVFPESVVYCPRRIGAEFVSVSKEEAGKAPEPMRLVFRAFDKPVHELSICIAPLYGNESKWLQIAEWVEHHKLEGFTYFYFHIGGISNYDRRILDYYERNGDMEVKVLSEKYERPFYAWQLIEIQDCHQRAKYHSKWTAFIDIDERIATNGRRFIDLLGNVDNGAIGEIQMPILNVVKTRDSPGMYEGWEQVKRELIFENYISSADPTWNASKALIRPEKVGIMSIHYAIAKESGYNTLKLDSTQAVVRHYRSTQNRADGVLEWDKIPQADGFPLKFTDRPLALDFCAELTRNVQKVVQEVYEKIPVNCSTIPRDMWESRKFPDPCERMLLTW